MDERHARVLELVAETYIDTARPVPSKFVAEQLDVSSATVRNDYASLEHAGLLHQPHTSAGRIPTAYGFRWYASRFLPPAPLPSSARRRLDKRLAGAVGDQLYLRASRLAAELSGYAVTVRLPPDDALQILEIHLATISSVRLLAMVVLEDGFVRQLNVDIDPVPPDGVIDEAERNLRQLTLPTGEVPSALTALAAHAGADLARTLRAISSAWHRLQPHRLFSDGLARLLDEPEGNDPSFVKLVVEQVERPGTPGADLPEPNEPGLLLDLDDTMARVVAAFPFGSSSGSIALVGPARMRYPAAMTVAHELRGALLTSRG